MFALGGDGFDGRLFEELGSDEVCGFFGDVGVFDLGACGGGVGEFFGDGRGFGGDGFESCADGASSVGDGGVGLFGEVLGFLGVGEEELGDVGEGGGLGGEFACFRVDGLDGGGGEFGAGEAREGGLGVEGGGDSDVVDGFGELARLEFEGFSFFVGEGAGVGGLDGERGEFGGEVGEDGEGAVLGSEEGGFSLEGFESFGEGVFARGEFGCGLEGCGVVGGAVELFACGEALEGGVEGVLVGPEGGEPEVGQGCEGDGSHGVDIGRLGGFLERVGETMGV